MMGRIRGASEGDSREEDDVYVDADEEEKRALTVFLREFRKRSRKAVTGDGDRRIRDHLIAEIAASAIVNRGARKVESLKQSVESARSKMQSARTKIQTYAKKPPVVKTVDKVLFTVGVAWVALTEYVFLTHTSDVMAYWVVGSLVPMLAHRVFMYSRTGLIYFCIDFCYFVTLLCFSCIGLGLGPTDGLFRVVFAMANGPLVTAVLVWRNSFVFHDMDRVCSTMLHALPPIWTYSVRWSSTDPLALTFRDFKLTMALYVLWQAMYIAKTEWWDRDYILKHQDEATSLRWLVRSRKGAMNRLCKACCVRLGLMTADDEFEEELWSTKFTFWLAQLAYTVISLAPALPMWYSRRFHAGYLIMMYAAAIYNGASYYIEIFSSRYNLQFVEIVEEPTDQSATTATEVKAD